MFQKVHFIDQADADAPPLHLWYRQPDVPMTIDLPAGPGIHHPAFGKAIKARYDELGLPCELRLREDWPDLSDEEAMQWFYEKHADFLRRHLKPGETASG